jgi:hypothetical protein
VNVGFAGSAAGFAVVLAEMAAGRPAAGLQPRQPEHSCAISNPALVPVLLAVPALLPALLLAVVLVPGLAHGASTSAHAGVGGRSAVDDIVAVVAGSVPEALRIVGGETAAPIAAAALSGPAGVDAGLVAMAVASQGTPGRGPDVAYAKASPWTLDVPFLS